MATSRAPSRTAAPKTTARTPSHAAPRSRPHAAKTVAAAAKPAAPAPTVAAPLAVPAHASAAEKAAKPKKPKLVRDSFTIPKSEYALLDALKLRSAQLARPAKKSELLRAGIKALSAMDDAALLQILQQVPALKTGRPAAEASAPDAVEAPAAKSASRKSARRT